MGLASKAEALLGVLQRSDIEKICPAQRKRLADTCRYVAAICDISCKELVSNETTRAKHKSGVLAELERHKISHE